MRIRLLYFLLILAVISALSASQPLKQPPLEGKVVDQRGKAISVAYLKIVNRTTVTASTSGRDGRFSIRVPDRTPRKYG